MMQEADRRFQTPLTKGAMLRRYSAWGTANMLGNCCNTMTQGQVYEPKANSIKTCFCSNQITNQHDEA